MTDKYETITVEAKNIRLDDRIIVGDDYYVVVSFNNNHHISILVRMALTGDRNTMIEIRFSPRQQILLNRKIQSDNHCCHHCCCNGQKG